jgi:hypothetical protein
MGRGALTLLCCEASIGGRAALRAVSCAEAELHGCWGVGDWPAGFGPLPFEGPSGTVLEHFYTGGRSQGDRFFFVF